MYNRNTETQKHININYTMSFPNYTYVDGWELFTLANREIAWVIKPDIFRYNISDESNNYLNDDDYDDYEELNFLEIDKEYETPINYSYEDTFSDMSDNESPYSPTPNDINEEYEVNSDNEWFMV